MGGYIGSKAVSLSTTSADVTGNADIGGDLTVDTNTLYVDSTNDRVLINYDTSQTIGGNEAVVQITDVDGAAGLSIVRHQATTGGPSLRFAKSRVSTKGDVTIVQDGDQLGRIEFIGADGTDLVTKGAQIEAVVDGTPSANDMPSKLVFSITSEGGGSLDNGMTLTSSNQLRLGGLTGNTFAKMQVNTDHIPAVPNFTSGEWYNPDGGTDGIAVYYTGGNDTSWGGKSIGGVYSKYKTPATGNWCGFDFIDDRTASNSAHRASLYVRTRNSGLGDRAVWKFNHNGSILPTTDNAFDLGGSSNRLDDIYATNSTIQTSDENEKQQVASLTDAEMTAAKAISKLFKTFKWNSAVEAKGDAARTHSGVIAQQVEQAMTDAGLDADDYAFFVRAVHYTDTVEGREILFDYDDDERTETATKHEKLAIRYPELLSFVAAATEQRLASMETEQTAIKARLDALEAN